MKNTDLAAADQLRQALADYELSDEQRLRIQTLLDSVDQKQAAHANGIPTETSSELMDELRDTAAAIETEHPHLTGIINQILVSLSSLGI